MRRKELIDRVLIDKVSGIYILLYPYLSSHTTGTGPFTYWSVEDSSLVITPSLATKFWLDGFGS